MRVGNYWEFQANDDTRGGWLAVLLYLILAILCWREVAKFRRSSGADNSGRALSRHFWVALSLFVTALGVNKQLDFQTLMLQLGREAATSEGIIEYKQWINWAFLAIVGSAGVIAAGYMWTLFRRAVFSERLVLVGTAMLGGFIFFRTASINHVDLIVGRMSQHRPLIVLELLILLFLSFVILQNSRSS